MMHPESELVAISNGDINLLHLCMHECGHYYASIKHGFLVKRMNITYSGNRGFLGFCEVMPAYSMKSIEKVKNHLESRIITLMAGAIAETLRLPPDTQVWHQEAIRKYQENTSASDKNKVDELLLFRRDLDSNGSIDEDYLLKSMQNISDNLWSRTFSLFYTKEVGFLDFAKEVAAQVNYLDIEVEISGTELSNLLVKHKI